MNKPIDLLKACKRLVDKDPNYFIKYSEHYKLLLARYNLVKDRQKGRVA